MADRLLEGRHLYKLGKYRQALSEFLKVSDEPLNLLPSGSVQIAYGPCFPSGFTVCTLNIIKETSKDVDEDSP